MNTVQPHTVPAFNIWRNRRVRMFPIWFFESYLTFTVFLFAFGPWNWPVPNPILLYSFLLCVQVALWFGYKSGLKYAPKGYSGRWKIDKLLLITVIVNLAWIVPNIILRLGLENPDFSTLLAAAYSGATDPGMMYAAKQEALRSVEKTGTPLLYLSLVVSPLLALLLPLGILYWERMRTWMRIGLIVYIVTDVLSWIAIGTNKGIADLVALIPWLLLARNPRALAQFKFRRMAKLAGLATALIVVLLIFFSIGQYGRSSSTANKLYESSAGISADKNNILMQFLPPSAQGAYASFTTYLTQGYYGLSLALQEPFICTYGLGNSYFLTGLSKHYWGPTTISDMTYPARIERYGWDRYRWWPSFYTWVASDVSFIGVILVVFLIGRLFAIVWLDVLGRKNPFAGALFALLIIMLYYFPANNQILGFSATAISFWIFLFLWLKTRGHSTLVKKRVRGF
jgi:hypothetical protein